MRFPLPIQAGGDASAKRFADLMETIKECNSITEPLTAAEIVDWTEQWG
jgi:hypothetical protein